MTAFTLAANATVGSRYDFTTTGELVEWNPSTFQFDPK